MIIATTGQAAFSLSGAVLTSLYEHNSDGLGFLELGSLTPIKCLPATVQESIDFYHTHIHGKQGTAHWRMRTDGDVSLERVHPYRVHDGAWLFHNGILSQHRSRDKRSDTQLFIEHFELETASVRTLHDPHMQAFIGEYIGSSNRFVVCSAGEHGVINASTGWTADGLWWSNTYAVDTSLVAGSPRTYRRSYGTYSAGAYATDGMESSGRDWWEGLPAPHSVPTVLELDDMANTDSKLTSNGARAHYIVGMLEVENMQSWDDDAHTAPSIVSSMTAALTEFERLDPRTYRMWCDDLDEAIDAGDVSYLVDELRDVATTTVAW
jgi:predicted glutamine amidotransferase